jgi:hypothetical protein
LPNSALKFVLDLELLDCLNRRHVDRFLDARVVIAVHDADAVEQKIGLRVAAAVGYKIGDKPGCARSIAVGKARSLRDSRSEAGEIERIAIHERQIVDELAAERDAESCIRNGGLRLRGLHDHTVAASGNPQLGIGGEITVLLRRQFP